MTKLEQVTQAIREEIVRQYRDDDRAKCPGGSRFWEEEIQPWLIARVAVRMLRDPTDSMLDYRDAFVKKSDALLAWQLQIDEILTEKSK